MAEINTFNAQAVSINSNGDITVLLPKQKMTPDEALTHAAWLVALADPAGEKFGDILQAIQNT